MSKNSQTSELNFNQIVEYVTFSSIKLNYSALFKPPQTSEDVAQYNINKITHQINHKEAFTEVNMENASAPQKVNQEQKAGEDNKNKNLNIKGLDDISNNLEKMSLEEANGQDFDKECDFSISQESGEKIII